MRAWPVRRGALSGPHAATASPSPTTRASTRMTPTAASRSPAPWGTTYTLTERTAPEGFALDTTERTVVVDGTTTADIPGPSRTPGSPTTTMAPPFTGPGALYLRHDRRPERRGRCSAPSTRPCAGLIQARPAALGLLVPPSSWARSGRRSTARDDSGRFPRIASEGVRHRLFPALPRADASRSRPDRRAPPRRGEGVVVILRRRWPPRCVRPASSWATIPST